MPACFVTNEVMTNPAGIALFFFNTWISVHVICMHHLCVCVCACVCVCVCACLHAWKRERKTEKKVWERQRHRERHRDSERESEGGREWEKNMLGTYYATKCTRRCMEWNITPKVSPHLPFISLNHISHSIKRGHPQHTIKPHFHSVSISIVIFHTAHRATGSSSLIVYSKQYRISAADVGIINTIQTCVHACYHGQMHINTHTHIHTHVHKHTCAQAHTHMWVRTHTTRKGKDLSILSD